MATNNTVNPFGPPPPSQVAAQSIAGSHPVQAPPANSGVTPGAGTIAGGQTPFTYNDKKGKGNN